MLLTYASRSSGVSAVLYEKYRMLSISHTALLGAVCLANRAQKNCLFHSHSISNLNTIFTNFLLSENFPYVNTLLSPFMFEYLASYTV